MQFDFRRLSFLTSAAAPAGFPGDIGCEVAFAGRSNAGKSSALNAIAGVRNLARVSKTPGRTRLVNFFALDDERRFVDLPGYGYAEAPPTVRAGWEQLMQGYFGGRHALAALVLVMDIRKPMTDFDRQLLAWLAPRSLPVLALLSKSDKLTRTAAARTLVQLNARAPTGIQLLTFSAHSGAGVEVARAVISGWLGEVKIQDKRNPGVKGVKHRG